MARKLLAQKYLNGVTVKFELLDDDGNVVEVLAEKEFPDAKFSPWATFHIMNYRVFDKEVGDWVYDKHNELNRKYDYIDYDNCPDVRQAFYNNQGKLLYWESEVEYEYNL